MIDGSFDQYGRPYVQGRLALPRLHVDNYVDFLVDTGADTTTMHPRDGRLMGTPYDHLLPGAPIMGMGGIALTYVEPAIIVFQDGVYIRVYSVSLAIPQPQDHNERLPSVLGQDIIGHWRMVHDKPRGRLTFTAQYADLRMRGQIGDLDFSGP